MVQKRKIFLRGLKKLLILSACLYSTITVALDFDKEIAEQETVTVTLVDGMGNTSASSEEAKESQSGSPQTQMVVRLVRRKK